MELPIGDWRCRLTIDLTLENKLEAELKLAAVLRG